MSTHEDILTYNRRPGTARSSGATAGRSGDRRGGRPCPHRRLADGPDAHQARPRTTGSLHWSGSMCSAWRAGVDSKGRSSPPPGRTSPSSTTAPVNLPRTASSPTGGPRHRDRPGRHGRPVGVPRRPFDLIVHPVSNVFVPDVKPVWREAFRVLSPGGSLLAGFMNPVHYLFDDFALERGEFRVAHRIPYSDLEA